MRNVPDQLQPSAAASQPGWQPCADCLHNAAVLSGMAGAAECPLIRFLSQPSRSGGLGPERLCLAFEAAFEPEEDTLAPLLS